jgi:hypothetical protein
LLKKAHSLYISDGEWRTSIASEMNEETSYASIMYLLFN